MRQVIYCAGSVLGTIGFLLLVGSFLVWLIGLETLTTFYESNKLVVFSGLAGVGLLVLGIVFSSLAAARSPVASSSRMATGPGAAPEGSLRCGKCQAINDLHAKYCDQCGGDLSVR
jgi:hypothetical protein